MKEMSEAQKSFLAEAASSASDPITMKSVSDQQSKIRDAEIIQTQREIAKTFAKLAPVLDTRIDSVSDALTNSVIYDGSFSDNVIAFTSFYRNVRAKMSEYGYRTDVKHFESDQLQLVSKEGE